MKDKVYWSPVHAGLMGLVALMWFFVAMGILRCDGPCPEGVKWLGFKLIFGHPMFWLIMVISLLLVYSIITVSYYIGEKVNDSQKRKSPESLR